MLSIAGGDCDLLVMLAECIEIAILPPDQADFVAGRYFQPAGLSISGQSEYRGNVWIYMVV
jgi:hypothetical protein